MASTKRSRVVGALAIAAGGLMVASYFLPLWWVSLTAPNYPKDAFPDGIRIQFQFFGVTNGCTSAPKASHHAQETLQEDLGWRSEAGTAEAAQKSVLDCMHEMNTINHYVGMHPIGFGAPVERQLAKFIIGFFAVMLVGFAIWAPGVRLWVMGLGFAAVSGWMFFDLFGRGQLDAAVAVYVDEAGRYFREAERIAEWGVRLRGITTGVAVGLTGLMAFVAFGVWRWPRFQLLLALVPALLPVYFVAFFAGWLWFFGHNMHPWGAFTLKPFMPTVFGDGKVAQFTTHSYPHVGFALLGAMSVLLLVAAVRRRHELMEISSSGSEPMRQASPTVAATHLGG